jgi:hypothetical protein
MNKRIKTYEDLEQEQQRLLQELKVHEDLIKIDIAGLKEDLKPFNKVYKTLNKIATRDNTAPVMNFGMEMGIDILIRKFLLAKAGWLTKIVVPFVVKNYSSHFIGAEKREALMKKVKNIFIKLRPKSSSTTTEFNTQQ